MNRDEWYFRVGMRTRALTPIIDETDLDRLSALLGTLDEFRRQGHSPESGAEALCDLDLDTLAEMEIRPPHERQPRGPEGMFGAMPR